MESKKRHLVLSALIVIQIFPAFIYAASANGQITVSQGSKIFDVKLNMDDTKSDKGFIQSVDQGSGDSVRIQISYITIDGEYAWFAGKCTDGRADKIGEWLFGVVHDGGKPGNLVDHLWWEWIGDGDDAEAKARAKVDNLQIPSGRKAVQSGDIKIGD